MLLEGQGNIAICIPTRWLAGKTQELAEFRFGVRDMGRTVDLMEEAFEKIANDGEMMLDKEFMMNIFEPIVDQVEPFAEYLEFIFENKEGQALGSRDKADKWLPFDELRAELFFPTRNYVRQTHSISCRLAEVAAATFLIEFRYPKKATSDYLSSISGIGSWAMVTDEDKVASQSKDSTTSISESVHASSTVGLGIAGTIRLDHVTAEGQTRSNNDFGRGHERLVRGSNKSEDVNDRVFGTFHQLPEELRRSLILFGKENASKSRKKFDEALASQQEARRQKEEIA